MSSSRSPGRPGPTFARKRRSGREAVNEVMKVRADYGLDSLTGERSVPEPKKGPVFDERISRVLLNAGIPEKHHGVLKHTRRD